MLMGYFKWILLAVCLVGVVWPLLSKSTGPKKDADVEQKD
jgi:hypothetical protein